MTFGIEVQNAVVTRSGALGYVVDINDWSDRYPADVMVDIQEDGIQKFRADELTVVKEMAEDSDFWPV